MKVPSDARLHAMSPEERMNLRRNALRIGGELGNATIARLEALNLPVSSGGMSLGDPIYCEMQNIVWSAEGKEAAVQAIKNGLPALAGVDPLLQRLMGSRYGRAAQGTMNAGSLVAEVMRHLGYEKVGEAPLPSDCVA